MKIRKIEYVKGLLIIVGLNLFSQFAFAQAKTDQVDLKKLEDKYWAAKDDEYGVIQNRTFSKTGKMYASLVYGPLINDPFAKAKATGAMFGYFINFSVTFSFSWEPVVIDVHARRMALGLRIEVAIPTSEGQPALLADEP